MAGVDVEERERDGARVERLARQVGHHDGVLAAREHQDGALELRGHLAHDEDGLGLEGAEVRIAVGRLDGRHVG